MKHFLMTVVIAYFTEGTSISKSMKFKSFLSVFLIGEKQKLLFPFFRAKTDEKKFSTILIEFTFFVLLKNRKKVSNLPSNLFQIVT